MGFRRDRAFMLMLSGASPLEPETSTASPITPTDLAAIVKELIANGGQTDEIVRKIIKDFSVCETENVVFAR